MPCKRRACSFWRRCSSCSDRSASIPRKSKWWLEDVEGAGLHRAIGTERILSWLQPASDRIDGPATTADAAHDAVTAVAGIDGHPRYLGRAQERSAIRRVGVL